MEKFNKANKIEKKDWNATRCRFENKRKKVLIFVEIVEKKGKKKKFCFYIKKYFCEI